MNKVIVAFLLLSAFTLPSCSSSGKREVKQLSTVEKQLVVKEKQLDNHTKVYLDGAIRALKSQPKDKSTKEQDLALHLLVLAQDINGVPLLSQQLDIESVLLGNTSDLIKMETETKTLLKDKQELEVKKEKLEEKVKEKAIHIIQTQKTWYERFTDNLMFFIISISIGCAIVIFWPQIKSLFGLLLRFIKPV